MRRIQKQDRTKYWFIIFGSLFIFLVSSYFARRGKLVPGEIGLINAIYGLPAGLTSLFKAVTFLGSGFMFVGVLISLALFRKKLEAGHLFLTGIITIIIIHFTKVLIGRPRPIDFIVDLVPRADAAGMGFPSGHTAMATALSLSLLPYLPRRWCWLVPTWIILVGVSRIYLGVHAPLDIIGGLAVGIFVATTAHILYLPLAPEREIVLQKVLTKHKLRQEV